MLSLVLEWIIKLKESKTYIQDYPGSIFFTCKSHPGLIYGLETVLSYNSINNSNVFILLHRSKELFWSACQSYILILNTKPQSKNENYIPDNINKWQKKLNQSKIEACISSLSTVLTPLREERATLSIHQKEGMHICRLASLIWYQDIIQSFQTNSCQCMPSNRSMLRAVRILWAQEVKLLSRRS